MTTTPSSIPDPVLAAQQAKAEDLTAQLAELEAEHARAKAEFRAQRKTLKQKLLRLARGAKAYRGETERKK